METFVYRIRHQIRFTVLVMCSLVMSACSTTSVSNQSATDYSGPGFKNILVIGVANDYEGRASFERRLASELKANGANASALYVVGGGNKPIERSAIEALVQENGYDAVLISRVLNRDTAVAVKEGSAGGKATRMGGRAVNLFRYDYEELNEPPTLDLSLSVTISTELFAADSSDIVWAIESAISGKDGIDSLVSEAVETIIRQLRKDGLVGS